MKMTAKSKLIFTSIFGAHLACLVLLSGTAMNCTNRDSTLKGDEDSDTVTGAEVRGVEVSGSPENYRFSVEIRSPDTGCDQYADWWEVISPDGKLIYRRILAHSHVNEQPFIRSGSPVEIAETTEVIVRAHMNNLGYGTRVHRGTVRDGLMRETLGADFAGDLETADPLPRGCDF